MNKISFLKLIIILVFIAVGCAPQGYYEQILGPEDEIKSTDMYHELNQGVDTDKIVGDVSFNSVFEYDIFTDFEERVSAEYILIEAEANWQMTGSNLTMNELTINNKKLTPTLNGKRIRYWGYPDNPDDIKLYYGNELNSIIIAPTDFFGGVDTVISIGNKIQLANITTGDTIHTDNDFTFEWNYNTGKYVEIFFHPIKSFEDTNFNKQFEYDERFIVENFGVYTFSQKALQKLPKGEYLISLTTFDRKFLYDDIGRIFMATITSKDEQRIFLAQ